MIPARVSKLVNYVIGLITKFNGAIGKFHIYVFFKGDDDIKAQKKTKKKKTCLRSVMKSNINEISQTV